MTQPPTRVLCLGGGWVAVYLAHAMRRAVHRGEVDLTVVSRDNYHTLHGFIPEMLSGRIQANQIISPARRIFPPARFVTAEVQGIELERRRVIASRALDGREYPFEYDHLVIALGSVDDLSRYAGVAEHSLRLKNYWDAFKARSHLLSMLEMAQLETDPEERRRLLTFVVVGGNFGGIEVAAELHDLLRSVEKQYPGLSAGEVRVVVVHAGERILPELVEHQPQLVAYAERFLARAGLEIRLRSRIAAATAEEAILSDGTRIPTRTILSCAGSATSPLLDTLPFERDERGRLRVDATGRVPGTENVWAAGDCAALPHPQRGVCPTVATYAMYGGKHVGKNLLRHLRSLPLQPFRFSGIGEGCSLGRRRAIAHLRGIRIYGLPAWIIWRLTFLYFVSSWDRRLRILLDWMLTAAVGRDLSNIQIQEPFGVRRELYEPGQEIVREGDVGRRLYLIWKGEAEVVRCLPDGRTEVVAALGEGDHFGEIAVFHNVRRTATVRARSRVELVSLGQSEALTLGAISSSFGSQLRSLPGRAVTGA